MTGEVINLREMEAGHAWLDKGEPLEKQDQVVHVFLAVEGGADESST